MPNIPMINEDWPRAILPIMRDVWTESLVLAQSPIAGLMANKSSVKASEYSMGFGNLPIMTELGADGKGRAIQYEAFDRFHETTFTHKSYAQGVTILRETYDDMNDEAIKTKIRTLGTAFAKTEAFYRSSILKNAFSTDYVGGDAKALCATDHPKNKTAALDYGNKGTTAFDYDSIAATIILGMQMTDDSASEDPAPVVYNKVVIPPALMIKAREIFGADFKPGTADNDANGIADVEGYKIQVIVDPYLTNAKDWFMIDSSLSAQHMRWYWRTLPELTVSPMSDYLLEAKYRGFMRFSYGWTSPLFVYGHDVA